MQPDDDTPSPADIDENKPLTAGEADVMGFQVPRNIPGHKISAELVYGEADGVETEDNYDAHHADSDQHV
jgi:hypothetical protein